MCHTYSHSILLPLFSQVLLIISFTLMNISRCFGSLYIAGYALVGAQFLFWIVSIGPAVKKERPRSSPAWWGLWSFFFWSYHACYLLSSAICVVLVLTQPCEVQIPQVQKAVVGILASSWALMVVVSMAAMSHGRSAAQRYAELSDLSA